MEMGTISDFLVTIPNPILWSLFLVFEKAKGSPFRGEPSRRSDRKLERGLHEPLADWARWGTRAAL